MRSSSFYTYRNCKSEAGDEIQKKSALVLEMVHVSLKILGMNSLAPLTIVAATREPLNLLFFFFFLDKKHIFWLHWQNAALLLQIVTLGGRQRPKSVNSWPT